MSLPGNVALKDHDPEMHLLIEKEKNRQWKSLELIASEVRGRRGAANRLVAINLRPSLPPPP